MIWKTHTSSHVVCSNATGLQTAMCEERDKPRTTSRKKITVRRTAELDHQGGIERSLNEVALP
jgi:hypothetical protein